MTVLLRRASVLGALAFAALASTGTVAAATTWTSTNTHGLPILSSVAQSAVPANMPVHVMLSLKLQNQSQLTSMLHNLHTPGNPQYNQFMTPGQFAAAFSPTSAQVQPVVDYLKTSGFTNIQVTSNRTIVSADGTAALAQTAFNTKLSQFQYQGKTLHLPVQDVQVPASLNGIVLSVLGLQNVSQKVPDSQHTLYDDTVPPLKFGVASARRNAPLHTNAADPTGATLTETYTAAALRMAYDADATPDGSNTVVAISTAGTDLKQVQLDLQQAERDAGLPYVPTTVVQSAPIPDPQVPGNDDEWDLDSQSASGIGTNVKEIIFYNATDLGDSLVMAYNDFATQNRAKMGNMSYGGCETLDYVEGSVAANDQAFMQAVMQGQTWFASSGDAGAACGILINLATPQSGVPQMVEAPASSPYVVAVGGTSLFVDSTGNYALETAWTAGGGGTSLFETAPDWQSTAGVLGAYLTLRGVPDIAMNAGFNLSPVAAFYSTYDTVVDGRHESVIGTSLSSPLAMGVWSRLQSAHCNALGFAAPILYALDSAGGPTSTATGFNDIILGTNGGYVATPGWDYTTGFGTFDVAAVNKALPAAASSCVVANAAPLAQLATTSLASGPAPFSIGFDASASSDPDGDALSYFILDFGDGSPLSFSTLPGIPAHTYAVPGNYVASLTVRDARGGVSKAATQNINVTGPALACTAPGVLALTNTAAPSLEGVDPEMGNGSDMLLSTYIAEPSTLSGKLVVTMNVASLATVPSPFRWVTYFSTKTADYYLSMDTSTGPTPNFTYGLHGTLPGAGLGTFQYLGALDASSNYTADGVITLVLDKTKIPLNAGDVLTAISTSIRTTIPDDTTGTIPGGVGLTVDSAGDPNNYTIVGTQCVVTPTSTGGSTTGSTTGGTTGGTTTGGSTTGGTTTGGSTTGGTTGGTTTGGSGSSETVTATLTATPTSGTTPLQVAFDASGSSSSNGTAISSYTFYFGDGSASQTTSSPTLSFTYTAAGTFNAQVVATDANGYTAASSTVQITSTATVTVTGSGQAVAAMTVTPTSGSVPLTVQFDGSRSFGANGNAITTYTFDFGDGSQEISGSSATVSHVYTAAGTYNPTLSVTDSQGNTSAQKAMATVKAIGTGSGGGSGSPATASGSGGGAFGFATLLPMMMLALRRRRRH
jgi:PKD repeat protein